MTYPLRPVHILRLQVSQGQGASPLWIRGIKVRRTGFFFLAEQAPGSVTGDGQDELVVRTERDPRYGERVAFEWLAEWPERFRIVDPNCGVLRGCGFTCCCEQLSGRGDGYGNGLESRGKILNTLACAGRDIERTNLVAVAKHLFYLRP